MNRADLLQNIHETVDVPIGCKECGIVTGKYDYFHYKVDGFDDKGWGCGYRTLQTLCSWVCNNSANQKNSVPNIKEIQTVLVEIQDKPSTFIGSKEWIGSYEVFLVLDHLYNVSCKIIHVSSGPEVPGKALEILQHFVEYGSPVMIGGDNDASSKTLLGVCQTENQDYYFLIADPHFIGCANIEILKREGWLQWKKLQDVFMDGSFYNFCLPLSRFAR